MNIALVALGMGQVLTCVQALGSRRYFIQQKDPPPLSQSAPSLMLACNLIVRNQLEDITKVQYILCDLGYIEPGKLGPALASPKKDQLDIEQ